jgi:tetratricopeptide (TPR) repeat protein
MCDKKRYCYHKIFINFILFSLFALSQFSCKKYLDKKPQQSLVIPSSLSDLQAILDNQSANQSSPWFLELVADDYYLTDGFFNSRNADTRKNYLWATDAQILNEYNNWILPYKAIYHSNFVLDFLPKIVINESERSHYNSINGTALFYRAFMFHQLSQLFCKPYSLSANTDPGIVVRTTSVVGTPVVRSTVKETYDQIIADLTAAAELLPANTLFATRPNKAAAYGMLARVYLSMGDYSKAVTAATASLDLNNTLIDYKALQPVASPLLPNNYISNPEVLFLSETSSIVFNLSHNALIDSFLYQSYDANDIRKTVFFGSGSGNTHYWKGSYYTTAAHYSIFTGIATDEIYLIRAESRARTADVAGAMNDLNTLLRNRWKAGFTDLSAANETEALNKILPERRKELLFRGLRWSDLRRYNLGGANITLTRVINGVTYTLPPNDLRWVLLIPELEISLSGIPQNPR